MKHETIAILEALSSWEDKLLRRKICHITDHKSLEYFETQPRPVQLTDLTGGNTFPTFTSLSACGQYLANRVADLPVPLLRADGPEDHHPDVEFMSADAQLDPDERTAPHPVVC